MNDDQEQALAQHDAAERAAQEARDERLRLDIEFVRLIAIAEALNARWLQQAEGETE